MGSQTRFPLSPPSKSISYLLKYLTTKNSAITASEIQTKSDVSALCARAAGVAPRKGNALFGRVPGDDVVPVPGSSFAPGRKRFSNGATSFSAPEYHGRPLAAPP